MNSLLNNASKANLFESNPRYIQFRSICKLFSFLLISLLSIFYACKKDKNRGEIPLVAVNISLALSLPEYAPLNSVGNSIEIYGGYKGILVYHRFQNEFVAFELACPYDPLESNAKVEKDSSNVIGVDYNCGSKFYLTDGSVLNGPANQSLKQYQTDYDPVSHTLNIYN